MLIVVLAAMAAIVAAYSIWFFPQPKEDENGETTFKNFTRDVLKSFSVFAPKEPAEQEDKVNVDELRAKVFGDKIER
ncbi:MAG: hypothetical protein U1C18_00880 [Patescibacteria group bacterium]|nr:hypothetical protein [Patescibacteria group bacterium]